MEPDTIENVEISTIPVNENDIILVRFTDEVDNEEARALFEELQNRFQEHLIVGVRPGVYLDSVSRADYRKWLELELQWLDEGDADEDIL